MDSENDVLDEENEFLMTAIFENKRHAKAVKKSFFKFMHEEVDAAHERARIRLAYKFKFLLSSKQQKLLEAQYPLAQYCLGVPA